MFLIGYNTYKDCPLSCEKIKKKYKYAYPWSDKVVCGPCKQESNLFILYFEF